MRDSLGAWVQSRFPIAVLAVLGFAAGGLAVPTAAQIVPVGGDIAVSQPDGNYESGANVAADHSGGWGASWTSRPLDSSSETGRQRRFDRDGRVVPGSLRDHEFVGGDLGLDGEGEGVLVGVRPRPDLGGSEVDAQ